MENTLNSDDVNLFVELFSQGRLAEAETLAKKIVQQCPDNGVSWKIFGAVKGQQGLWLEALQPLQRAAELLPNDAESQFNLGLAYQNQRRFEDAGSTYLRALELKPDYAEALNNLGLVFQQLGDMASAETAFHQAIAIRPDFAEAHNNLGLRFHKNNQLTEAIACFNRALERAPEYAEAYNNLGAAFQELGHLAEAETSVRQAIRINPHSASAHSNLGNLLLDMGRLTEAETSLIKALELNPDSTEAYNNLGNTYQNQKRFAEAEFSYRRAAEINPLDAVAHNNLGTVLQEQGQLNAAGSSYRKALEVDPNYHGAHSNLLFSINYLSVIPPAECLAIALQYGTTVTKKAAFQYEGWNVESTPSRLRVGLVSGDLLGHPVGYFLENVVSNINPDKIELLAYPTHHLEDALTARIRPYFKAWKSLQGMDDATAAHTIHSDGVHILLDISGHTAFNKLPVFAWKPAPVQASWLGYFATTGVKEIDYLIADPWTLPETEEINFSEEIWRLPETRLCFTPPDTHVEVSVLPALTNGYITFGCFNHLTKMNDVVVEVWAKILAAIPTSKLFLKSKQLDDVSIREFVLNRFMPHGIAQDRLILEGISPRSDYLKAYHKVDICLDPFPFTGATTSAESLWMGVPVLTLAGERFVSRQGVGLLENAGLHDWVAKDQRHYIEKAIILAGQLNELAELRSGLRQQVLHSPVFDAARFAGQLENALWGMWQNRRL
jgi:protein O-GlcNAc transferase